MALHFSPFVYSVVLLCVVLLGKYILSRMTSSPYQPLYLFRFYCLQLANKVNNTKRSEGQQKFSGLIAVVITLFPLFTILWLFSDFIEMPFLWHGALLFIAIDAVGLPCTVKTITTSLNEKNTHSAKKHLAPWVLRDIETLSPLGITKSCIEMQLLRTLQQLFSISFYFLLLGPLAAFMIRLIFEMHYSWNIKKNSFKHFGASVGLIVNIIQWLPVRLFSAVLLVLSFSSSLSSFWKSTKAEYFSLSSNLLMASLGALLNIKLGGVAIYDGGKIRRKGLNAQGEQPKVSDIKRASSVISQVIAFYLLLLLGVAALLWHLQS